MNVTALTDLEDRIDRLTIDEQLCLMERLARRLRKSRLEDQPVLDHELAAMAADPEIQRELKAIEEEFAVAEADGLEQI